MSDDSCEAFYVYIDGNNYVLELKDSKWIKYFGEEEHIEHEHFSVLKRITDYCPFCQLIGTCQVHRKRHIDFAILSLS